MIKKTPSTIQITEETKKRITPQNYTKLPLTKQERVLCALIVNLSTKETTLTAENFLQIYNWFVGTLHQGIKIDFEIHPSIKDTELLNEAYLLKGDETENLINRKSCIEIAKLISNNDETFARELDSCYTEFEVKLLLFSFSPNCAV